MSNEVTIAAPELAHRRAALQVVVQLPAAQADALLILEAAKQFVLMFLAEDHFEADRALPALPRGREGVVLALVSATSSASADLSF